MLKRRRHAHFGQAGVQMMVVLLLLLLQYLGRRF
jgi:hypothetical protein